MHKNLLLLLSFVLFYSTLAGQPPKNSMLFVIDSIPILTDPEDWNPILQEDIADSRVVRSRDTVKLLGYKNVSEVTYIFTKEYRNRPDSLKLIPSLKQMEINSNIWNLHNIPYSGKYIDYFNSGKIQDEGTLLNGKLNGQLVVYFKNGHKKSISNYKTGVLNGEWNDYYTNGMLLQNRNFLDGEEKRNSKMYFINGQIQTEIKFKKDTHYDTAFRYYSTGKIREMTLMRNGEAVLSKKKEDINCYTTFFNQRLNNGDIKELNKLFFRIWKIDSSSIDTYFLAGMLYLRELHFDKAITEFDKALITEPMMREALVYRAVARIKNNQYLHKKTFSKNSNTAWTMEEMNIISKDELNKICSDIRQAEYLDFSNSYVKNIIPELFFNYCITGRNW